MEPLILGTACLSETVVARCVVLNSFPLDRLLKSRPCRHEKVFMTSLYKSIANVTFLFDEQKKDGSFPIKDLQVPAKKKEYKYQQKPSNSAREYTATIILHEDNEQEGLKIVSAEAELWFKGSVVSQVIIHSDAVVKEAEEASGWAVKSDILRTLSRRLDMHWHSLVEEDINSFEGEKMVHEPPRRVLFPLCDNSITFSDHLFPGEDVEENVDLINSTFNVHLDIADVQEDLEQHDKTRALKVVRSPNRVRCQPCWLNHSPKQMSSVEHELSARRRAYSELPRTVMVYRLKCMWTSGDCSGTFTPFLPVALRAPRTHDFLRIHNSWSPECDHALHSGLSRIVCLTLTLKVGLVEGIACLTLTLKGISLAFTTKTATVLVPIGVINCQIKSLRRLPMKMGTITALLKLLHPLYIQTGNIRWRTSKLPTTKCTTSSATSRSVVFVTRTSADRGAAIQRKQLPKYLSRRPAASHLPSPSNTWFPLLSRTFAKLSLAALPQHRTLLLTTDVERES
uniref:Uncharacterized protein n=1 Tax=Timema douglasi TaxID=61478 RepID=A0A7R8VIG5_TIMDO|nr:unnamed protein product [Timema douglasi]